MHKGSCLCGLIRFEVKASLFPPDACHCLQCRKHSGHYFVSTDVARADLVIHGAENIRWFQSSEKLRRGFCCGCGSSLFGDPVFSDQIAVTVGAFDSPTDTRLAIHIHVAEKGDYYDIVDDLPQNQH